MSVLMLRPRITEAEVRLLVRGETAKARAQAAHKICLKIVDGGLSPHERKAADEVLRIMAADEAVSVRVALALTLKSSPHLPRDVAMLLARDSDKIAIPVLEESPVFEERDLIALLRSVATTKQIAIARREKVPAAVAEAIVDYGAESAVAALARNDSAELDAATMMSALTRFGDRAAVTDALIARAELPSDVAERLVSLVSEDALHRLARRHALPPELAVELAADPPEGIGIDLLDQAGCATDMAAFVKELQLSGLLTPSLMVRGLCLGHVTFFEHAMAELAGVPHGKAWVLIHDSGPMGLQAIFERTGAPARFFAPIRAALAVHRELERDGLAYDRNRTTSLMVERLLSCSIGLTHEETDYLLAKLDAVAAAARARLAC